MCSPITCPQCAKPGWRGCGAHVEQILGHVPKDQRCKCGEKGAEKGKAQPASPPAKGGVLDWLRSRM